MSATAVPNRSNTVARPASVEQQQHVFELKRMVHDRLLRETEFAALEALTPAELARHVGALINVCAEEARIPLAQRTREAAQSDILDELIAYGPIQPFLDDPSITEVMVNGADDIYIERFGQLEKTSARFHDDDHVQRVIERIVTPIGRRIDESSPMVDARLPDGSRVNAIIPPLAIHGSCITIRKFSREPYTPANLVSFGTLSEEMSDFARACVVGKLNVIISGGTGSGKTTTLNALSSFIPHSERVVTIEDAAELQLQQPHVISLESRPPNLEGRGQVTIQHLVRNSLRMRPDRIIVGECRGGEALDMIQAMNTGHQGSLSTIHSNSTRDMLSRLETMVLMAGTDLPSRAIREQISAAIDLVIHQSRLRDGTRRVVQVSEIQRMEGDTIVMQDIFVFRSHGVDANGRVLGEHVSTGLRPLFVDQLAEQGIELPLNLFAAERSLQ
jgi:pilus assembly protein CpaF